jgi:transketolase
MNRNAEPKRLQALATQIRRDSFRMISGAGSGHIGGTIGAAEIFAVLYGAIMNIESSSDVKNGPDRFVLSNGHLCAGWYSALSLAGFLPRVELGTHRKLGSRLQGHPSKQKLPELVETSTGPLGQGFSVASGIALGKKLRGDPGTVYCIVGDGEVQEGVVWETVMTAAHHRLQNLTLIINDNDAQIDGPTSVVKNVRPLDSKMKAFGWRVINVDGHDIPELIQALEPEKEESGRPLCVIARTIMAKGVSFMEGHYKWHGECPSDEQTELALKELGIADGWEDF